MKKQVIRLTESDIHQIIINSAKQIIREMNEVDADVPQPTEQNQEDLVTQTAYKVLKALAALYNKDKGDFQLNDDSESGMARDKYYRYNTLLDYVGYPEELAQMCGFNSPEELSNALGFDYDEDNCFTIQVEGECYAVYDNYEEPDIITEDPDIYNQKLLYGDTEILDLDQTFQDQDVQKAVNILVNYAEELGYEDLQVGLDGLRPLDDMDFWIGEEGAD